MNLLAAHRQHRRPRSTGQDADPSAAGVELACAAALADDRLTATFLLFLVFLTGTFLIALRFFGTAVALADVAGAAGLAALLTLAQRTF